MVAFDFLSSPIELNDDAVNVLCVENKPLFRNVLNAFVNLELEESNIVFSKDYKPVDFKKIGTCIYNYFDLNFSSSFLKKIYDDIALFCNTELMDETSNFISSCELLFDSIARSYDYEFDYSTDFQLQSLFKTYDLKPVLKTDSLLEALSSYITLTSKYTKTNLFVLFNLHQYFDELELKSFYSDMLYNHIFLLVIENNKYFSSLNNEKTIIIDSDMCEIVE